MVSSNSGRGSISRSSLRDLYFKVLSVIIKKWFVAEVFDDYVFIMRS